MLRSCVIWFWAAFACFAQSGASFKLATFESNGKTALGIVIGGHVLDIAAANTYLAKHGGGAPVKIPAGMRDLIERYEAVSPRLHQIASHFQAKAPAGLAFAHRLSEVRFQAPIKYPYNLLNMAANYHSHAKEMGVAKEVDPDVDDPYVFAKSPRSCIIDPDAAFFIPPGRDRIDWEGELALVIGKPAKGVSLANAVDYIFGYSVMYDVSDRGGGKRPHAMFTGPDWFSGKSRDGAAPFGPYIVPKEFVPNYGNLRIVTRVNDRVVQDNTTADMIYDVPHIMRYVTSIMTLYPGDVISTGTPAGVGVARKPPEFLKPGDVVSIEVEGIGTLRTPIQAAGGAGSSR
jgi:2-keto-4-pentenoate hydratase/2-oxohepta-3-ene-1,7-dioic acid hydratase in catechol pathway